MTSSAPQRFLPPERSIWQHLWGFFLTTAPLFALLIIGSWYGMFKVQRMEEERTIVLQVEAHAAKSLLHALNLTEGIRNAYGTQDTAFLKQQMTPWIQSLEEDAQRLDALMAEMPPNSPVYSAALHVKPYYQQEFVLAQSLLSAAEVDNWPSARIRLKTLENNHRILLGAIQQLIRTSDDYRETAFVHLTAYIRATQWLQLATLLLGLIVLVAFAFETRRYVILPLQRLTEQAQAFAEGDLSARVELHREDEIGRLAHTFNLMADRVQKAQTSLAQRVEERTQALQRRTQQLQAATEIGRAVSTERDLASLLDLAARLVSQRFGYYHVGIFLATPTENKASLQAAYSQTGDSARRLLEQHYQIDLASDTPISLAIRSGRAHTTQYPSGKGPSEACADTRAEAAIPLRHAGETLGVLDVHTNQQDTFTPEDITALQTAADMLAVAIVNARLLRQAQEAVEATRRAYEALSQQGWERFLQRREIYGVRLMPTGEVIPLASPKGELHQSTSPEVFALKVRARGQVVATAYLRKATPWTAREKRLMETFSERLGMALEGARLYAEAQRRAAQLQIAAEIAREASATLDLDTLLKQAINLLLERFGFYHASVFLLDESGQYAVVRESTGEAGEQMKARQHRLAVGSQSTVGQALEQRKPVVINDITQSETHHFNPLLPDTRAEAAIPLMAGDRIIGALDVQSTQRNAFSEEDIRVMHILADQLAVAIINAELFAQTQQHLHYHQQLHQIIAAAASANTVEQAMQKAVAAMAEVRPAGEGITAFIPDENEPNILRMVAHAGEFAEGDPVLQQGALPTDTPLIQRVATSRIPEAASVLDTPRPKMIFAGAQSEIAVPLHYRDEFLGVLLIRSPQPRAYQNPLALERARTLSQGLGAIVANIGLLETAQLHAREVSLLYEITAAVASQVDLTELLNTLTSQIQRGLDLLHCGVVLFDANGKTGTLVASASAPGAPASDIIGVKLPLDDPLIQEARESRKPVVCKDVEHDERVADIRDLLKLRGTKQIIVVPLLAREEIIGTLGLDIGDLERKITERELRLVEQIAHQIATSVEVARLFQQAVRTAEREHLVTTITTKMRATNDPQAILQTAITELQKALRAQQTQIVFVDEAPQG